MPPLLVYELQESQAPVETCGHADTFAVAPRTWQIMILLASVMDTNVSSTSGLDMRPYLDLYITIPG